MNEKTVWIETYGCQMNKAESEAILLGLAGEGWRPAESAGNADLVILNTCSVRRTAEDRIRGRVGHYRRLKTGRRFILALVGCMAERLGERLVSDFPEIDVVAGTFGKRMLVDAVRRAAGGEAHCVLTGGDGYEFAERHSAAGFKAFVPIMHGCNNFCSYCIVPYVRGREVSRPLVKILQEISGLDTRGALEITLLGQNVNSYRYSSGNEEISFPALLRAVSRNVRGIRRVRFLTSHPRDLSDSIIDAVASDPLFCRSIHLPLQSGSTRILREMNRGYSAEDFLALVGRIRTALTGVALTTDILIGFPGETEEDFHETLDLMECVGFDDAFMYHYNPREGTTAYTRPDTVGEEIKLARLARVIEVQKRITARRMAERLGNEVEVLVEGVSKRDGGELLSRTEWDSMAVFPGGSSRVGSYAKVRLQSVKGCTFRALPV
jgi:tRNA-2-methylthio-N6-dimethylallyladenosine synthase